MSPNDLLRGSFSVIMLVRVLIYTDTVARIIIIRIIIITIIIMVIITTIIITLISYMGYYKCSIGGFRVRGLV